MKKFIALILALILIVPLAACGGGGSGDTDSGYSSAIDNVYNVPGEDKTVIKFRNSGGGFGHLWIDVAAEKFAQTHQNTEFESGKKGVYIDVLDSYTFDLTSLKTASQQIVMGGFSTVEQLAALGLLYDVDSIVKDTTREGGSIEDNMMENRKGAVTYNGKYYAVPFTEYYGGCTYNYKFFDEQYLFFADRELAATGDYDVDVFDSKYSDFNEYFTNSNGPLSKGPDGVAGTEDDGMAVSMEQFLVLMDYIKNVKSTAPMVLSGMYTNYSMYLADGFFAALAGAEKMNSYYNGTGTVECVVVDGTNRVMTTGEPLFPGITYIEKPQTQPIELNATNGWMASRMVEKYYTYALIEIMQREGFWSNDVKNTNLDHYGAQQAFLMGRGGNYQENAAMLVEASYWYNEAREVDLFDNMEFVTGKKESDLDVRQMCLPCNLYTQDAVAKATSFVDISNTYLMINNNVKDTSAEAAVVEFYKYLLSEAQLKEYTIITGMPIGLKYDYNGNYSCEALGTTYTMSTFGQHLWEARKVVSSEVGGKTVISSNIVGCTGNTSSFYKNADALQLGLFSTIFKIDSSESHPSPYKHVKDNDTATCFAKCVLNASTWRV